jgi:hypothetical protein
MVIPQGFLECAGVTAGPVQRATTATVRAAGLTRCSRVVKLLSYGELSKARGALGRALAATSVHRHSSHDPQLLIELRARIELHYIIVDAQRLR